jgi:hypothetical protein
MAPTIGDGHGHGDRRAVVVDPEGFRVRDRTG